MTTFSQLEVTTSESKVLYQNIYNNKLVEFKADGHTFYSLYYRDSKYQYIVDIKYIPFDNIEEVNQACQGVNIPESEYDQEISILPNPAMHKITIQNLKKEMSIGIYNVWGACVLSLPVIANGDQTIDIQNFVPGIYIINVTREAQNEIIKFIKE